VNTAKSEFRRHTGNSTVRGNRENRRTAADTNPEFTDPVDIAFCIFRAGQFFPETVKAETVMYALAKDTAKFILTFNDKDGLHSFIVCGDCGCHPCGPAADDKDIHMMFSH
jgi:hypothetical protein